MILHPYKDTHEESKPHSEHWAYSGRMRIVIHWDKPTILPVTGKDYSTDNSGCSVIHQEVMKLGII